MTMSDEHNEITLIKRNQSKVVRPLALSSRQTQPEQQPHNYMILANSIFYNGQSADRIYLNGAKIWEKTVTPPTPTYGSKTFAGKFIDDTTESDWVFWPNGQSGNGTSIEQYVDPETKEFNFEYDGTLTSCYHLLNSDYYHTGKFQRIDHIPDTSGVTNMNGIFGGNRNLEAVNLSDLDTSNVTDMSDMFYFCMNLTSLDVSNFDTSNVTDMSDMFKACVSLTSLDLSNFNTSNVTDMSWMFSEMNTVIELDVRNFDTSKVETMKAMFSGSFRCHLHTLYVNFNTSQVENMAEMFWRQTMLKNVIGQFNGTKVDLRLDDSPLTNASAMVFINGLAEVATAKTIKFKATTFDTLTPEQLAIANSKGWSVVRS